MTTQICSAYCGVLRCKLEPHHEGLHVAKGSGLLWGDAANGAGYFNQADAATLQEQINEVVERAGLVTVDQAADLVAERDKLLAQSTHQKNVIVALTEDRGRLRRANIELEERLKEWEVHCNGLVKRCDDLIGRNAELEETTTQPSAANDPHFIVRMQLLEELNTALMRIWQLDLRKHQADQF